MRAHPAARDTIGDTPGLNLHNPSNSHLSFMTRLAILVFIAGLYLIGSGGYDLFIQVGTSRQPTTVSVAELEKALPANRHLVVTGGRPVAEAAVKFYKKKWGAKVSGSEILFIPIVDDSTANPDQAKPSVLLRVTEDQIDVAKAGQKINFKAVEGVRTTSMDLEDKARQRLVDTYGEAAVERMVILDYHGSVGMGGGLGKLAGGLAIVGGMIAAFVLSRKSKQPTPALTSAVPPTISR
jgi:hypothetical protein